MDGAHRLFVRAGYEETSTEAILSAAGVSRGAFYHHFPTKQALFEAVFERVSAAAIERAGARSLRARTAESSPLEQLVIACLAWLAEARDPAVGTILLDQGPQVLGWLRARDIENRHSLAVMKAALRRAAAAGEIELVSVDLAAGFLNAALAEAALAGLHRWSGMASSGAAAKKASGRADKTVDRAVAQLIRGFRV